MKPRPDSLLRISAAVVLACTTSAHSADFTWNSDGGPAYDGNWTDTSADGWNGGPPVSGDTATITNGKVTTTVGDQTYEINLNIGGGTLDSGGNYMRVEANTTLQGGTIIIGRSSYNAGWLGGALGGTITVSGSAASSINGGSYTGQDINMGNLTTFAVNDVTTGTDLTVGVKLTDYYNGSWSSSSLVKNGAGTLALTAANNYGGATTVNGGTLVVEGAGQLYSNLGWQDRTVTVNSGGTLQVDRWDGGGSLGQLGYNQANIVINGGTIRFTGNSNGTSEGTGFTIGASGATLESAAPAGQVWNINYDVRLPSFAIASNSGGLLTLSGAGNGLISKVIPGSGGLTKTGAGTWTLSGANTYSGATTVKGGTLKINTSTSIGNSASITVGDTGSTGAALDATTAGFTVGSAQTLSGIGTIFATGQTVTASGTISPGNSVGTLTINGGTLALDATTDFVFELGTSSDLISLVNSATLNLGAGTLGLADFLFSNSGGFGEGVYTLISGASSFSGSLDSGDLNGVVLGYNSTLSMSGNNLILTVVPEPHAALLGSLGTLMLLRRRRA